MISSASLIDDLTKGVQAFVEREWGQSISLVNPASLTVTCWPLVLLATSLLNS